MRQSKNNFFKVQTRMKLPSEIFKNMYIHKKKYTFMSISVFEMFTRLLPIKMNT